MLFHLNTFRVLTDLALSCEVIWLFYGFPRMKALLVTKHVTISLHVGFFPFSLRSCFYSFLYCPCVFSGGIFTRVAFLSYKLALFII